MGRGSRGRGMLSGDQELDMPDDCVIRTRDLTKRYAKTLAVDGLTIEVPRGEVFGFLGPNGAGKTTTIAMLLGLVRPTSGQAELLGHDIRRDLGSALRRTGATIESPAFYPYLSGRGNLEVIARVLGGEALARMDTVLEQVGLSRRSRDRYRVYSMGMKQRLALGAALLNDPELLILDEPTNGLDPAGIQETRLLLRRLVDEQGKTVFLSSHLLHEVQQVCDRVVILQQGHVIAQGKVADLLRTQETVEVEVLEQEVDRATSVLTSQSWIKAVKCEGRRLHLQVSSEQTRRVSEALAQAAIYPSELRRVTSTLEDLFLDLTGKANA
jgi:ABC-2 type transport system ATP-binding protein